jgi:recombination protein RecA
MFGEGISKDADILDIALQLNIAQKSGSWFSYGETRLGQGRENAKVYLREHLDTRHEIENTVRAKFEMKPLEALAAPDNFIKVNPETFDDIDESLEIEIIDMEEDD